MVWDSPSAGIDLFQSLEAVVQPLGLPAPITLCITHLPGQLLCHPHCKMRRSSGDAAVLENSGSNNRALASLKILV